MKKALFSCSALSLAALLATNAAATPAESTVQASNGVAVTVFSDDFEARYEVDSPKIDIPGSRYSFAIVSQNITGGTAGPTLIAGDIFYSGDWRNYGKAVLRGGEAVDAKFGDHDVVSCAGASRGGDCTLSEGFRIALTREQIKAHMDNGFVQVQLDALAGEPVLITVPLTYFDAVEEVASRHQK